MRISDWSSDVCSSDLRGLPLRRRVQLRRGHVATLSIPALPLFAQGPAPARRKGRGVRTRARIAVAAPRRIPRHEPRSEEHTSELQSLMRISYAVFCLKKKTA